MSVARLAAAVAVVAVLAGASASAQEGAPGYSAHVHAGGCDDAAPGEVVAALGDPVAPEGEALGANQATVSARSYSVVPVALADLLGAPHAIDVHRPGEGDGAAACGELGGPLDANGALAIVLQPTGGSNVAGIAYLVPSVDPTQTGVSVFVAEIDLAPAAGDAAPQVTAAVEEPAETPVPTAQPTEAPLDESDYATTVRRQVTLLVASILRVDALFDAPRLGEEEWTNQLVAELTLWQLLYEDARRLIPPPAFADFHARYLDAVALLDGAATDIFATLETGDAARLTEAGDKIERAIQALQALDAEGGTPPPATGTPPA